jgi:crotonobetainyl-CoA:carnitine CoA-transferase CaiB-like acyl-CoA transferase
MPGALEGVRVVDFGHYIAGPLAAVMLSDQGADVIHVDPPGGPRWKADADAFLNRGKRRIALDLKQPDDPAIALRLIEGADVLIENFRPGVMDRLGLGADRLRERHPGLIYCSLPGFAADDLRAGLEAWEGIVDAATGNCRARAGEAPPDWDTSRATYSAIPLASNFAAFLAATSVVMALIARHRGGGGQLIEIPLFHAMFTAIGPAGAYVAERGLHEPRPIDVNGSGTYRCGDGRYVQFDPSNHRFLTWFAQAAGISHWGPELLDAEVLKDPAANARLHARLAELFLTRSAAEWEQLAYGVGAVLNKVRTAQEWLAHPHARAMGAAVQVDDPELGPTWMAGLPVLLDESPGAVKGPRHRPDADRAEILAELGREAPPPAPPHRDGEGSAPRLDGEGSARRLEGSNAGRAAGLPLPAAAGRGAGGGAFPAPLDNIRVLDLTQVLAGPTGGRLLAEFGADVVKINGPQRRIGSHGYLNRGKRTVLLDVESPRGQQVFWTLVERADVVIQNFPKGTAERYGIGHDQVRARKPDVIYASLSVHGHHGPWAHARGYERQGQAVTGVMDRVGEVPAILGPYNLVDVGTGVMTAFAVGLGVYHRLRTGKGQHVQSSLSQTATYHQTPYMLDYAGKRYDEPRGWTALGTGPTMRFYQARDGWLFVGARASEAGRIAEAVGIEAPGGPDLGAFEEALEARIAQGTVASWVDRLRAAGIGAQAVVPLAELMTDPWVCAHGLSVTQRSDEVGDVTYPGPSVRMTDTPVRLGPPVRQPGADAASVLREVGLEDAIPSLERQWALQTTNLPPGW